MLIRGDLRNTIIRAIALIVFLVAGYRLGLWLLGSEAAIEQVTRQMKANTSLSLTLLALSLLLADTRWGRIMSLPAAIIGTLTLLEYLTGWRLGIDEALRADFMNEESRAFPGRMAPNAAICLALLGFGFGALRSNRRYPRLLDTIFAATALISLTALIGYLYQANELYQVSNFIRISPWTAGSCLLLSISALFVEAEHPFARIVLSRGPEGYLARRLLPATFVIPILTCFIIMRLRDWEWITRPTAFSLLAGTSIVSFLAVIAAATRAVMRVERARLRTSEEDRATLATIHEVGQKLVAELDLEKLVQSVTDAATRLTGAQFGAFFYNVLNERGESFLLYTISGVPREAFSKFPMPRNTAVFKPTFMGEGTVRSDDITKDPRYGKSDPHRGMPPGHLPVRSYLATSVVSKTGEVLGGLFFGHAETGVFTAESERIVEGLAAQTAIAMDNARLYQQLQESVHARDEFLSIASHELKTPITTLKLQTQTRARRLARGTGQAEDSVDVAKWLETEIRQINRLSRLIDDMLDVGRINARRLDLRPTPFDLGALMAEVATQHAPQFEAQHSKLILHSPTGIEVQWDRDRIEQVLTNLITNAFKYGADKPVELAVERIGSEVRIVVRDQGIGIPRDSLERVFGRFERAVSASEISGFGLGLFISKQIVLAHGGTIRVESDLGKGSSFIVTLPERVPRQESEAS